MIIDQLPLLLGDCLLTDEFPIERGTTTYKATLSQIFGSVFAAIEPNFAGAYDSTATYAVGDYVVYEHTLYVCNTAIPTAEQWTAAHWTQVDIGTVLQSKQDNITANGILKGNGTSVSAATLGTNYGARSFSVTLPAASWSNNEQTVTSQYFVTVGYGFIVSPASSSFADYASAAIYADDVTSAGQMTFHCTATPATDLTVNIIRVVSA